jgi:glycine cleavage system H protein
MKFPAALKFTKEHEWVQVEDNVCTVGVTDYAQSELGDIIYLDITSNVGSVVKKGDVIGSIEAVKTVSEIFSPVSGKILEINSSINDNPSIVNTEPYDAGWIVKIEASDKEELNDLLDSDSYKELVGV